MIVSDMTKDGAYDGFLDGVDYIFHVASPLPSSVSSTSMTLQLPVLLTSDRVQIGRKTT